MKRQRSEDQREFTVALRVLVDVAVRIAARDEIEAVELARRNPLPKPACGACARWLQTEYDLIEIESAKVVD